MSEQPQKQQEQSAFDNQFDDITARIQKYPQNGAFIQLLDPSKQVSPLISISNSMIKLQGNSETVYDNNIDQQGQNPESQECFISSEHKTISSQKRGQVVQAGQSFIVQIQQTPVLSTQICKPQIEENVVHSIETLYEEVDFQNMEWLMKKISDFEQKIGTDHQYQANLIDELVAIHNHLELEIKKNYDNDSPLKLQTISLLRVCVMIVQLHKQTGNFKFAIKWLIKIRNKFVILDPNFKGKLILELGKLYFLDQSLQEAYEAFYEALLHYEKYEWRADIAYTLLYQARLNAWMRNYEQSKKLANEAIFILKEVFLFENEQLADGYFIMAECCYLSKDYEHSIEFLTQALELKILKYNNENHLQLIELYNLFGLIYAQKHDSKKSLSYFCQALNCFKWNSIDKAQILNNIAVIKLIQGQLEHAERCKTAALQIYLNLLDNEHSLIQRLVLNFTMSSPIFSSDQ